MRVRLTQDFINNDLVVPEDRDRVEFLDDQTENFFIEVRASNPGNGTFWVRYRDRSGTTRYVKVGKSTELSLMEARAKAKEIKASIALGADPRAEARAQKEVLKYAEFMELHYLPHARKTKRSSADDARMNRLRLAGEFGQKRLNQITRYEIIKFHGKLKDEGLAPATCDHYVKLLKHSLNIAIDWGLLNDKNPAARIPLFNADNQVENLLSEDELNRLLLVLRTDSNRAVCQIILYMLATGCRLREALQAQWSQIDLQARVWTVPATTSKSKRNRPIPLTDTALDVLQQLDTRGSCEYLFKNKRTNKPYVSLMKQWIRIKSKANLSKHMRLHDTRHTTAQLMCAAGRSLLEVQAVLGHRHYSTTSRYAKLSMASVRAAANVTSLRLGTTTPPISLVSTDVSSQVDSETDEAANTASVIIQGAGSKAA